MTFNEYQQLAARTINKKNTNSQNEYHALFGMCSEVGELQGLYQKKYQGHLLDRHHAMSEVSDLLWFIAEWCTANEISLDDVAKYNIEKLIKRYPQGFEAEKSLHRAEGDI